MRIEIWSDVSAPGATSASAGWSARCVPFFVIDRKYGVSGAQSAETFLHALRTAYAAEDTTTH